MYRYFECEFCDWRIDIKVVTFFCGRKSESEITEFMNYRNLLHLEHLIVHCYLYNKIHHYM